jgi:class 3 adenylate cyclase
MFGRLDRLSLFYLLRIIGSYFLALVIGLYSLQFEQVTPFRLFLIGFLLIYPHVARYFVWRRSQDRMKFELWVFLVDSFLFGLAPQLTGFALLPSFAFVTVGLVNALAVNGFRQLLYCAGVMIGTVAISMLLGGVNFNPKEVVALEIAVSTFLFIYFLFFAYSVHHSNALLARSRTELREQKATLEIEKQRSDALLLNLVPTDIAAEFKKSQHVELTVFDPVMLLAVDFCGFSKMLEVENSTEVLEHLMYCFKAFDAITGRYGFEKLKTMGDVYLTIAGIPKGRDVDAVAGINAALEIRQFLTELNEWRRAHDKFTLEARIAVHTGVVIGGVVSTEKLSYDIWGTAVKMLLRLLEDARGGQILISDATRRLVGERFIATPAGNVGAALQEGVVFYEVEKRAA